MHVLAVLMQYTILKITGLNVSKLLALMHFGTRMNVSVLGSKGRRSRSQHDQGPIGRKHMAGRGAWSSHLYLNFLQKFFS